MLLFVHNTTDKLALFGNNLTGTIPEEVGELDDLGILYLDHNTFAPTVPPEICDLDKLQEFWSDCDELGGCDCCTMCCDSENGCS